MTVFDNNSVVFLKERERKKKYLKRYKNNKFCIIRLRSKLESIECKLTSIKSANYSCMPKAQVSKTTSDLIAEKIDLEKRILKLERKGQKIKEATYDIIDTISEPDLVEVMECLFIDGNSFEDTADILRISNRQLHRKYSIALDLIELPED